MAREQAQAEVLVDDERVRVTRFDFAPGAETGWHVHGHDYVVTPVTDCEMLIELPDDSTQEVVISSGASYRRDAGVKHNVVNAGKALMSFVEVELK